MVSGAYAAEYGQREDIDEAMKKVQVRRREANNWYRKVGQLHTKSTWGLHFYCRGKVTSLCTLIAYLN